MQVLWKADTGHLGVKARVINSLRDFILNRGYGKSP